MDLQDATEQYADMLKLGSQALQRLAERELDQPQLAELSGLLGDIVERTDRLKTMVAKRGRLS